MNTAERWRVVDTGLRTPGQNAALDRALLEAREADEIPGTLRFARYTPSVLLPALQDADPLLDADACRGRGLAIQPRMTDGGTFFCDGPHLGWSLYLGKGDIDCIDGRTLVKRLCHAAAAAVSALGVECSYRAPNEIVVAGRTLAQAGLLRSERAWLFQAVLTLEGASQRAPLLGAPWGVQERAAVLGARLTDLREALRQAPDIRALKANLVEAYESEFSVEFRDADLTLSEHRRYEAAEREQSVGPAHRVMPAAGMHLAYAAIEQQETKLSACVVLDAARVIRQVWFAGCSARPAEALPDLEAALRNVAAQRVETIVRSFFSSHAVDCGRWKPADFIAVVRLAIDQPSLAA